MTQFLEFSADDPNLPALWKDRLGPFLPKTLFGVGELQPNREILAIVGSRDASEADLDLARKAGAMAAQNGFTLLSGAARGIDKAAMLGALEAGGYAVGITAGALLKTARATDFVGHVEAGKLLLISRNTPEAGFTVGNAMARNKLIYLLARRTLIVCSAHGRGGTWEGAVEALKKGFGRPCVLANRLNDDPALAALADLGADRIASLEAWLTPPEMGGLFADNPIGNNCG